MVTVKNKFRTTLEANGINLKMLYKIMPRTSETTLKNLWYAKPNHRVAASPYYDAIANYARWKNKDWHL